MKYMCLLQLITSWPLLASYRWMTKTTQYRYCLLLVHALALPLFRFYQCTLFTLCIHHIALWISNVYTVPSACVPNIKGTTLVKRWHSQAFICTEFFARVRHWVGLCKEYTGCEKMYPPCSPTVLYLCSTHCIYTMGGCPGLPLCRKS